MQVVAFVGLSHSSLPDSANACGVVDGDALHLRVYVGTGGIVAPFCQVVLMAGGQVVAHVPIEDALKLVVAAELRTVVHLPWAVEVVVEAFVDTAFKTTVGGRLVVARDDTPTLAYHFAHL